MQTIFLSDLKVALLEHPQAWITQMEQQHWAQLRTIAEEIAEHRGRLVLERPLPP